MRTKRLHLIAAPPIKTCLCKSEHSFYAYLFVYIHLHVFVVTIFFLLPYSTFSFSFPLTEGHSAVSTFWFDTSRSEMFNVGESRNPRMKMVIIFIGLWDDYGDLENWWDEELSCNEARLM